MLQYVQQFLALIVCICLTVEICGDEFNEKSYATSVVSLEPLLLREHLLIKNLNEFAVVLQAKVDLIRHALMSLHAEHAKASDNAEAYLSNPLNSFALMRRMHMDWNSWQAYMKQSAGEEQLGSMERLFVDMPTSRDVAEAAEAIYRIQTTYHLNAKNISNGYLNGKQYDAQFYAIDCYAIGVHVSSDIADEDDAISWLEVSLAQFEDNFSEIYDLLDFNRADIWSALAERYKLKRRYSDALKAIDFSLHYKPQNEPLVRSRMKLHEYINNRKLCRGIVGRSSRLTCRYNTTTTPFLKLAPVKMEELSLDPYVSVYYDVISDKEIEEIKSQARSKLARVEKWLGLVENRSAQMANLYESEVLGQRIRDITGLSLEEADMLQVQNYGIGGHHYNHVDYYNYTESEMTDDIRLRGDRMAGIIFYLNDVDQGGQTIFPRLSVVVPARKGTAMVWYHLDETSHGNKKSQHASCTVVVGSKWVAVKMMYANSQMFKRRCYNRK